MKLITATDDLATINYVSLDLETTGINVNEDKIIEIGGMRIEGTKIIENETYTRFVNPQVSITQTSSDVHGITDEMVGKSPTYPKVHKAFQNFLLNHVVVGFNIGFDLGIIHAECQRAKLKTSNYRWLDVKFLAIGLNIATPSLSLEKLAEIFKVDITSRHRAEGDALTTAKIFTAFIPLLRSRGIRTLAQAERLTQQHLSLLSGMIPKNWYYPTWVDEKTYDSEPLARIEDLERIDPYPFSSQISSVMRKSIVFIDENSTVREAIKKLRQHDIGSLAIRKAEEKHFNLLSERQILEWISTHGENALNKTIADMNLKEHPSVLQSEYIYQAIEKLQSLHVNHLLVTNRHEELMGIVSSRDLMRDRLTHFHKTTGEIMLAKNTNQLAKVWNGVPKLCNLLLNEKLSGKDIARIISNHTIAMSAKAAELAIEEMQKEGKGKAPTNFALLVLGSGGRRESLLATDQDNALVYDLSPKANQQEEADIETWFLNFGNKMTIFLDKAGIKLCNGGVMAKNKEWCKSTKKWQQHINHWVASANGKAILQADIFFDYEFAYGVRSLSYTLKRMAFTTAKKELNFLRLVGEDIIDNYSSPLRFWGTKLATEQGRLDLKAALLFPVAATARLLAVRAGYYEESSTIARLKAVERILSIPFADVETLQEIYQQGLELVLKQQLRDLEVGENASNKVDIAQLSEKQKKFIKRSIGYLTHIEDIIRNTLFTKKTN